VLHTTKDVAVLTEVMVAVVDADPLAMVAVPD
jgi:hypothetical protein